MSSSLYLLQAAVVAASVFGEDVTVTQASATQSYRSLLNGGIYRVDALESGQQILENAGLLTNYEGVLTPSPDLHVIRAMPMAIAVEFIKRALLMEYQPLWLWAIGVDGNIWDNVPVEEQTLLRNMFPTAEEREAYLLGMARTVDAERLAHIGRLGEAFALDACRQHLRARDRSDLERYVVHVSTISDQLGYDITALDTGGRKHRLEVKSTPVVVDSIDIFLSRNEANYAQKDPNWSLLAVRVDDDRQEILGWCRGHVVTRALPVDTSSIAQWSSVRIRVQLSDLHPGLPLDDEGR